MFDRDVCIKCDSMPLRFIHFGSPQLNSHFYLITELRKCPEGQSETRSLRSHFHYFN